MMMVNVANVKHARILLRQFQSCASYKQRHSDSDNKVSSDISKRFYTSPAGIPGSGAGKGGGGGGSVRESGGGLGKYGAAQEEGYFHHKQREQLEKIKKQMKEGNPELTQKKDK